MNGFISHLLNRHMNTGRKVIPRLPGRFEPSNANTVQENSNETNTSLAEPFRGTRYKQTDNDKALKNNKDGTEKSTPSFSPFLNISKVVRDGLDFPPAGDTADESAILSFTQKDNTNNDEVNAQLNPVVNSNDRKSENQDSIKPRRISQTSDNEVNPDVAPSAIFSDDSVKFETKEENIFEENQSLTRQPPFLTPSRKGSNANPSFFEQQQQGHQPIIKVTIGRIDVKAVISPPALKKDTSTPQKPIMSLDEYLKKRDGNK